MPKISLERKNREKRLAGDRHRILVPFVARAKDRWIVRPKSSAICGNFC